MCQAYEGERQYLVQRDKQRLREKWRTHKSATVARVRLAEPVAQRLTKRERATRIAQLYAQIAVGATARHELRKLQQQEADEMKRHARARGLDVAGIRRARRRSERLLAKHEKT